MMKESIADSIAVPFIFEGPAVERHKKDYSREYGKYLDTKKATEATEATEAKEASTKDVVDEILRATVLPESVEPLELEEAKEELDGIK